MTSPWPRPRRIPCRPGVGFAGLGLPGVHAPAGGHPMPTKKPRGQELTLAQKVGITRCTTAGSGSSMSIVVSSAVVL